MFIYHKYVAKNLIYSTLFVGSIAATIIWLAQNLRFVDLIIDCGLNMANFLYLTFLLFPPILLTTLPIAYFIGVIYSYNKLYYNSELIVLSSSGLSKLGLLRPALTVGALLCIICYSISLYLMPVSNFKFKETIKFYKEHYNAVLVQEGTFIHPAKDITMLVLVKNANDSLEGIFINDSRTPNAPVTIVAKRGRFIKKNGQTILLLTSGNRQEIGKDNNYQILYFDNLEVDFDIESKANKNRGLTISEMHINQLLFPDTKNHEALRINKMRAEAHNRILWPLLPIIFSLIAVEAVIGGEYNRIHRRNRIFKSVIKLIALLVTVIFSNDLGGKYPILIPFQYLVIICFSYYMFKKYYMSAVVSPQVLL